MRYLWCIIAFQYVIFVTAGVYVVKRSAPEDENQEDVLITANLNITKVENDTLYEGDMRMPKKEAEILYESDQKRDATIANSIPGIGDRWPKTIPYLLDRQVGGDAGHSCMDRQNGCMEEVNKGICTRKGNGWWSCCGTCKFVWQFGKDAILAAMDEITKKTCLNFTEKSNQKDYLHFVLKDGCFSNIGRQGGRQEISLGAGCWTKRIATHEILHALGFLHEQSRPDRDSYVKLLKQNIAQGKVDQFNKYDKTIVDSLGESYDYKSIMHYWNKDFSSNGNDTIQKKDDANFTLGVRDEDGGLSVSDAEQLNMLYGCKVACRHWPFCSFWELHGLCQRNPVYMKANCCKSCKGQI